MEGRGNGFIVSHMWTTTHTDHYVRIPSGNSSRSHGCTTGTPETSGDEPGPTTLSSTGTCPSPTSSVVNCWSNPRSGPGHPHTPLRPSILLDPTAPAIDGTCLDEETKESLRQVPFNNYSFNTKD